MPPLLHPREPPPQPLHAYTLPDTGPRTSAPPAPVFTSALQPRAPSGIPEINGSPAGFIALVVALSLITILASLGAVLLARDKPLPHLRLPVLRASPLSSPHEPIRPRPDAMRARLARLFGRRPDGWLRADADAWSTDADADDVDELSLAPAFVLAHGARVAPPRLSSSSSQDSVEAGLAPAPHYVEPFAARYVASPPLRDSPSPASSVGPLALPGVRIHEAGAPHAPPEPAGDSDSESSAQEDSRVFAVRARDGSGTGGGLRAMRKFENGTKFREALDL